MQQIITLWEFSCNLYQEHNVETACLALQDDYQANIPLLLFACWSAICCAPLNPAQIRDTYRFAQVWEQRYVRRLRHLRRRMKAHSVSQKALPAWNTLREAIKTLELAGEKQLLLALEKHISLDVQAPSPSNTLLVTDTVHLIYAYFPHLWQQPKALKQIAVIVHAVHPQMQYDSVLNIAKRIENKPS